MTVSREHTIRPAKSVRAGLVAQAATQGHAPAGSLATLALGALGVVYGDIGTSVLYTLSECTHSEHGVKPEAANVLGVLSLIFWSLTMVVTLKYLTFIMRADNRGEGGIFALLALIPERLRSGARGTGIGWVALAVIAGAGLLYGDGMITPAISVLSAVEGLKVFSPKLEPWVVPLTCVILVALFSIQSRGTGKVGAFFGPVMAVWFATLASLGIFHIVKNPQVLHALNPTHAVTFLVHQKIHGFIVLGSVVLAITGGEALYADMGHFGAKPIRIAWLYAVMPALVLCYFGQGAILLREPEVADHVFFAMVPEGAATVALIMLSTLATIIASQALISGAYSLTHQAISLGFFPRVTVKHTSSEAEGQIYVPEINWLLAVVCIALVLAFEKSSKLAAAYGLAVTGTMGITSVVFFMVTRLIWKWPLYKALPLVALFLTFDLAFFSASAVKFMDGGFVPVIVGVAFFVVMVIWKRGRRLLADHVAAKSPPLDEFLDAVDTKHCHARVPGTAVFMASSTKGVPPVMMHHVQRIRVLHEHVVLLTIVVDHVPTIAPDERLSVETLRNGFVRVVGTYGFMETPDVPELLRLAKREHKLALDLEEVTYFLGRETFLATKKGQMGPITESIFSFLSRNSRPATSYFSLPPEQVVELGSQIDL
jgi:KUP system potassium uptake protein